MNVFVLWIVTISFLFVSCTDNFLDSSQNAMNYQFYLYQIKSTDLNWVKDSVYSFKNTPIRYYNIANMFSDAGEVKVGDRKIQYYEPNCTYISHDTIFQLDSQPITISVQGKGNIPQFSFNIKTPLNFCEIKTHTSGTVHVADNDLIIEWIPEITQDMTVTISIVCYYGNYKTSETIKKTLNDTGQFIVPSSTLKKMSKGTLHIVLQRGNKKSGIAPNGKKYSAYIYTQHELSLILQK